MLIDIYRFLFDAGPKNISLELGPNDSTMICMLDHESETIYFQEDP